MAYLLRLRTSLSADTTALESIEKRLSNAERERTALRQRIADAQQELVHMDSECDRLARMQRMIKDDIACTRAHYMRGAMDCFPPELLREIFARIELWDMESWYREDTWGGLQLSTPLVSRKHIRLPFQLAAVCRKWRGTVLSDGRLWSYIATGTLDATRAASIDGTIDRLICTLQRAKNAPLQVLLAWSELPAEYDAKARQFIDRLASNVSCIQRIDIAVPVNLCEPMLSLFKAPTPELVSVSVSTSNISGPALVVPACLPFTPKLRTLEISGSSIPCPAGHGEGLEQLKILSIWPQRRSDLHLIEMYLDRCTQLERLVLRCDGARDLTTRQFRFPKLRELALSTGGFFFESSDAEPLLVAPSLEELTLNIVDIQANHACFFSRFGNTITVLNLNEVTGEYLTVLGLLGNVTILTLGEIVLQPDDDVHDVDGSLFTALCDKSPTLWPKLRKLVVGSFCQVAVDDASEVLRLATTRGPQRRKSGTTAGQGEPETAILRIDLDWDDMPAWFIDEFERIMPPWEE